MRVFSVFDAKIGQFMRPFLDVHLGSALRSFEDACKEPSSPFAKYSADFILYEVGTFDPEKGTLTGHNVPQRLCAATDYTHKAVSAVGGQ